MIVIPTQCPECSSYKIYNVGWFNVCNACGYQEKAEQEDLPTYVEKTRR